MHAEIDLLCRDRGSLVLVEVKTGSAGARFRPLDRIDRERERRLRLAARELSRRARCPSRVDYVEVLLGERGEWPRLLHYRAREGRARLTLHALETD